MSVIIAIADAIVAELNGGIGGGDPALQAVRAYRPQYELAALKTVAVTVVPRSIATADLSRTSNLQEVSIDIAVQQKVAGPNDTQRLDELMALVERIADHFRMRRLTTVPSAMWSRLENNPVYAPDHLEQKHLFTSVLTLVYKVAR